jgi:hypothetical protein
MNYGEKQSKFTENLAKINIFIVLVETIFSAENANRVILKKK